MTVQTDEDEHSIELHLPYVRKVFEATNGGVLVSLFPFRHHVQSLFHISARVILVDNIYCYYSSRGRYQDCPDLGRWNQRRPRA